MKLKLNSKLTEKEIIDPVKFEGHFIEIINLIKKARVDALKSVNKELIALYWKIGEYISVKIQNAEWGDFVVDKLAEYIARKHPDLKGYNRRNLYRMKQFYETYSENRKVSALLAQITWTNHLLILSKSKTSEEREFYLEPIPVDTFRVFSIFEILAEMIVEATSPEGQSPYRSRCHNRRDFDLMMLNTLLG